MAPATLEAPDHPAVADALLSLAFAYAKLDRTKEELDAYARYLPKETEPGRRANALLNEAEAEMKVGRLTLAVSGYRGAIAASEGHALLHSTFVLAIWGLAVALDRAGNGVEAMDAARRAVEQDPELRIIGDPVSVFFIPAYERDWYLGLGFTALATSADNEAEAQKSWEKAGEQWAEYVALAAVGDPWVPLAQAHLATCTQAQKALRRRR